MSVALLVKYTALNYNAMIAHHLVFKENARLRPQTPARRGKAAPYLGFWPGRGYVHRSDFVFCAGMSVLQMISLSAATIEV